MDAPPISRPATERAPELERWLRSPLRRRLLIAIGVVLISGTTTLFWIDAVRAFEWPLEGAWAPWRVFVRRLFDWSLWGLLVEPIAFVAARASRLIPALPLQLVLHAALAFGAANGVRWVDEAASDRLFPSSFRQELGRSSRGGGEPRSFREGRGRGDRRGERRPEEGGPEAFRAEPDPAQVERWRAERAQRASAFRRLSTGRRTEIGVLIYAALLAIGSSVRSFLSQRDQERHAEELELRAAKLEGELSSARLASLENQLHPHFLFNALHSVGGLVRAGERETAVTTLAALGQLLRTTLDRQGAEQVSLADELELVERYLDIERIRLGDRLETRVEIERGTGQARVPTLLLLPLVENAVRYAIAPRPEGGTLQVRATRAADGVVLEVRDDGPGFPDEVLASGGAPRDGRAHIGLANTRERLRTLYGDRAKFTLENGAPGAIVRMELPLEGREEGERTP